MNEAMVAGLCHQSRMSAMRLRDLWLWDVGLDVGNVRSFPSSDAGLFYNCTNHRTFYSADWNCRAQNSMDTQASGYFCRSELCGPVLLLITWVVLVCWSFLPSFVCWPSLCACLQEDPYPCLVKQSQKRTLRKKICCNHISWDQLYTAAPSLWHP